MISCLTTLFQIPFPSVFLDAELETERISPIERSSPLPREAPASHQIIQLKEKSQPTKSQDLFVDYEEQYQLVKEKLFYKLAAATNRIQFSNPHLRSQFGYLQRREVEVWGQSSSVPCPRETALSVEGKFLHANYVFDEIGGRHFIASQLPLDPQLFWMFTLQTSFSIFDLWDSEAIFYPNKSQPQISIDNICVTLLYTINQTEDEYTNVYQVHDHLTNKRRQLVRYHYSAWQSWSCLDVLKLDYLVKKLETDFKEEVLIHSLKGIGRTGTLITAYFLKQRIIFDDVSPETLGNVLEELILKFRAQRGPNFVERKEQHFLLLDYGLYLLHHLDLK